MIPLALLLSIAVDHPIIRAERLADRLGGPSYVGRERAGKELVALGRAALPVLRRGQTHSDPEVAERCRRLLPLAEVEAIRQRVASLLDTPPKPVPDDAPRAKRFLAAVGDT